MTTVTNTGNTTSTTTANSSAQLNQNFDQFLTLLTTQLKNQDPLSPMDSTQFTNQLVSFSQVEQQIKTNDNLEKLQALTANTQTTLGLSYIGLQVEHAGDQFNHYADTSTTMTYELPSDAATLKISVLDQNGNVVYSRDGANGEGTAGKHSFTWDGTNNDGEEADPGLYTIAVGAADSTGKILTATTVVPGVVMGMQKEDDGSVSLIINGGAVPMSEINRATM